MIIHARSPKCIHDPDGRQPASGCINCPTDNVEYQRWCAFWDALPYVWQWDEPKSDELLYSGHWEVRDTGERVDAGVVLAHTRAMGVTVI